MSTSGYCQLGTSLQQFVLFYVRAMVAVAIDCFMRKCFNHCE